MPVAKKQNFQSGDPLWAIILSVILASVVMVYPLPYAVNAWRPNFMLLVMLFWVLCQPAWCSIWFAFSLGVFTDLLMEMPLGSNALCFVLIAFLVRFFTREKRIMTKNNLWVISIIVTIVYLVMEFMILILAQNSIDLLLHWAALPANILCWWIVYWGLQRWRAV